MNRRELLKGFAAVMIAAQMPMPVEALEQLADSDVIAYLKRVRSELIDKIAYPPVIMHKDGTIEQLPITPWTDALEHVSKLLKELEVA